MAGARTVELAVLAGALGRVAESALLRIPKALAGPLAEIFGTIAFLVRPRERRAVIANLAVTAPNRPMRAAMARRVFVEQTRNYLDMFRIPRTEPSEMIALVRIEGLEHFERAHRQGKGVVLATAHLGPVAFVGQSLLARGYTVVMPLETERSELQRAVNRARQAHGLEFIPVEKPLALRRVMKEGKVLGVVGDRAVTGTGERVIFFGREALLPSAHVAFAIRTGAPLIPGFARHENGVLYATFEPALELPNTGDRNADVREGTRRFGEVFERHVRRNPEQWTVFADIWEQLPETKANG